MAYAKELPIGGTAVGTGVNADPKLGAAVIRGINDSTKLGFSAAKSRFRAMRLLSDLVALEPHPQCDRARRLPALPGHQAHVLQGP